MQVHEHCLTKAQQVESPNQDDRPAGEVSLIVIHGISLPAGDFNGDLVQDLFTNQLDTSQDGLADLEGVEVSSHLFIRRDGSLIQFVPFNKRAWHAGLSSFCGRERCNDFSIGIELEGTDRTPYTDEQYIQLTGVVVALMQHYGIRDLVGHCHIAPARKTDPGEAFDWVRLRRALARNL